MKYANLPPEFYSRVEGLKFLDPQIVWHNTGLLPILALEEGTLLSADGIAILTGQTDMDGHEPLAMAYSGHQFGHYAPLLGDGRARLVGEIKAQDGLTYDIHLKGAGPTPYARRGDGRATIGAVIREAIVSEAMAALGVPTTRTLAILTTGEEVYRQTPETGAILVRTAQAHVRVGTFQFAAANLGEAGVTALADWTRARIYPEAASYAEMFDAICIRQAKLIAKWMSLGFIHGVMNTDNMMASGETVDYGPCAFMDKFHPAKVFSSIDHYGRYAWNKQADIGQWNLTRLAEALMPLVTEDEAVTSLSKYADVFGKNFANLFQSKLGLSGLEPEIASDFLNQTFQMMTDVHQDFTAFFTRLTRVIAGEAANDPDWPIEWLSHWGELRASSTLTHAETLTNMRGANPVRIPRNHRVAEAISAAESGNFVPYHDLIAALLNPYSEDTRYTKFETPPTHEELVRQTYCGT